MYNYTLKQGELMPKDELFKLDNFTKSYLVEKKVLNIAKNTIMAYESVLNSFYEYYTLHYDKISLEAIDRVFIINYLESLALSINSKNLHIVVLKNFFKYLQSHFYPQSDFKSRLEQLTAKAQKKEPISLSKNEYEKVMLYFSKEQGKKKRSFFSYRNNLLLKLLLLSGVRASELLGITFPKIALLTFRDTNEPIYKIAILGKGNKERYVYVPTEAICEELEYLKAYGEEHQLVTEHIAITKEGRVLLRSELYKLVESFLKNMNISKRGVHMLRHSFGKHLVQKNVNLSTIKELMGHENIQTTMIYARSDEDSMISAIR